MYLIEYPNGGVFTSETLPNDENVYLYAKVGDDYVLPKDKIIHIELDGQIIIQNKNPMVQSYMPSFEEIVLDSISSI